MGSLWRSEPMQLIRLFISLDAGRDTVDELGKLGVIQFQDLNEGVSVFKRNFVEDVKSLDELSRRLNYFDTQCNTFFGAADAEAAALAKKRGVAPPDSVPPTTTSSLVANGRVQPDRIPVAELHASFADLEVELIELARRQDTLERDYNRFSELKHVLSRTRQVFQAAADGQLHDDDAGVGVEPVDSAMAARAARVAAAGAVDGGGGMMADTEFDEPDAPDHSEDTDSLLLSNGSSSVHAPPKTGGVKLGFVTGTLARDQLQSFERVLWRATRGNLFLRHVEIIEPVTDPDTGVKMFKNVFIIFFQGARSEAKIKKICDSFSALLYPCPQSNMDRRALMEKADSQLRELSSVLEQTRRHRAQVLGNVRAQLPVWKASITMEKAIFHTLNLFNYDLGRKCLIAEGWCPTRALDDVQLALKRAAERAGALVPSILSTVITSETPPTYFRTNKVTGAFHAIVEAYGVARYREINPTVFTIITFPFLFGVMFGDFGHGILFTLFAITLILFEKRIGAVQGMDEMVGMIFNGRYMLLFMGLFATFCGLIYAECFSVGLEIIPSHWKNSNPAAGTLYPDKVAGTDLVSPVVFGVDNAWKGVTNELAFYNSLKMKLSIIFAVAQMSMGVILSGVNAKFFNKPYDLWFVTIPQLVFFGSLFGYLVFLIYLKWLVVLKKKKKKKKTNKPEIQPNEDEEHVKRLIKLP